MSVYRVAIGIVFLFSSSSAQWAQSSGPKTLRGVQISSVFQNGTALYVGCYRGGIYVSTDEGINWMERNDGLPMEGPEYVNTNDFSVKDSWLFAATDRGVFRSHSPGVIWSEVSVGLPVPAYINKFAIVSGQISVATEQGVYVSNDDGVTWAPDIVGLYRSPTGAITYVGDIATTGSSRYVGTADGVYRSSSPGQPWQRTIAGPADRIITLFISGQSIFAGGYSGGGVYFSSNQGSSWVQKNNGLPTTPAGTIPSIDCFAEFGGYLFVAIQFGGVFRSSDNGNMWSPVNSGLPQFVHVRDLQIITARLVAATGDGLFETSDGGLNWTPVFTRFPVFMGVPAIASLGGRLLASALCERSSCDTIGVFSSIDNGNTWQRVVTPFAYVKKFVLTGGTLYSCVPTGIYLSTNEGLTWQARNNGLPSYAANDLAFHLDTMVAAVGAYFLNGYWGGVFLSTDGGNSWNPAGLSNQYVQAVTFSGSYILAATLGLGVSQVYRSSNFGQTWVESNTGLPAGARVLAFLSSGNRIYAASSKGIYATDNSGSSWLPFDTGLPPNTSVQNIIQTQSALLSATSNGCFVSTDEGQTWRSVNEGLGGSIRPYTVEAGSNFAFLGSNSGLWIRALGELTGVRQTIPFLFYLAQNYPNPFNPTTTIEFSISSTQVVTLKVYNLLGGEVATLVDEQKSAGTHLVRWNPEALSTGLYFYTLRSGSFTQTRKLLMLK